MYKNDNRAFPSGVPIGKSPGTADHRTAHYRRRLFARNDRAGAPSASRAGVACRRHAPAGAQSTLRRHSRLGQTLDAVRGAPVYHVRLLQQLQQIRFLLRDLVHRALLGRLVRPPAYQPRAVAKAVAAEMVVADLHHELRLQRLPLRRTLGRPAARPAGRVAGKTRRRDQLFQFLGQRGFPRSLIVEVKPT